MVPYHSATETASESKDTENEGKMMIVVHRDGDGEYVATCKRYLNVTLLLCHICYTKHEIGKLQTAVPLPYLHSRHINSYYFRLPSHQVNINDHIDITVEIEARLGAAESFAGHAESRTDLGVEQYCIRTMHVTLSPVT